MEQIILIVHLLIALAIISLIMLQQGKGADMGASFGAGASQTLFGADGSGNVLTKATTALVVAFFVTSFALAIVAKDKATLVDDIGLDVPTLEVVDEAPLVEEAEAPVMALPDDIPAVEGDAPAEFSTGDDIPAVE